MRRLIFLFAIVGCTSAHAVRTETGPVRPPFPVDSVQVFRSADQVPGPYDEVGIIDAQSDGRLSEVGLIAVMRKKAAALGANAIVLEAAKEDGQVNVRVNRAPTPSARSIAIWLRR